MCGRYFIDEDDFDMQEFLNELAQCGYELKTSEIYPTNVVPILRKQEQQREVAAVKWGFPKWDGGRPVINARSETALEKSMFRKSLMERRCVIPSSGFYEWHKASGQKQKDKYHLSSPGSSTLYMAGMWSSFKSPDGNQEAFVILTTGSNASMRAPRIELSLFPDDEKPIHDRMPVILSSDEIDDWLESDTFMAHVLGRPGPELELRLVEP